MLDHWQNSSACSFFIGKDVHVWKTSLDMSDKIVIQLKKLLSQQEQERANRFHFSKDHHRFVIVRSILRILLAKYLQRNPAELDFFYNEFGKPFLKDSPFQFNVSHSGDFGLLAFDSAFPLGVDIEWKRPAFAGLKIAERFFSAKEIEELKKLTNKNMDNGFFNCWTRKEAYIKALGKGLAIPLSKFQVSLAPGRDAQLLDTEHDPRQKDLWKLFDLKVPANYAAALLVDHSRNSIFLYEIDQKFIDKYL